MLKDMQNEVENWVSHYKTPYWSPHEILAVITEEAGEIAREINHLFGPKQRKTSEPSGSLGEEVADLLFALCCLANSNGIDLDEAWRDTMDKRYTRDRGRF